MTVHAVLLEPPREGLVLPELASTSPLTAAEAADLYAAMAKDAVVAVAASGGDLLVNYPPDDAIPEARRTEATPEEELRSLVEGALADPSAARFEVQVGSSFEARAGNAATHLLREEDAGSVAILDARTPTLGRADLDEAAMKLRRSGVVIGPAPGGRVHYLGLSAPIDFDGAYAPPELVTLSERGVDAGERVDYLSMHPRVESGDDLATLAALIRARRAAGRDVPTHTSDVIDRLGLGVVVEDGERRLGRRGTDIS